MATASQLATRRRNRVNGRIGEVGGQTITVGTIVLAALLFAHLDFTGTLPVTVTVDENAQAPPAKKNPRLS
jgi:hypothetical protein